MGIAGGPQKCRHVVDTLGFDHCIDRRAPSWREDLAAATPDGIDLDFENVGGEIMDAVLLRLNVGARVVLCGMIAAYNQFGSVGQHDIIQFVMQRASLHGFLVLDHLDRVAEAGAHLGELIGAGKLHYDETIVDGLEKAPAALSQILDGENVGKMIVRVSETR